MAFTLAVGSVSTDAVQIADLFLCYQVEEFPAVSPQDVAKAMVELADQRTVLMFHAEMLPDAGSSTVPATQHAEPDPTSYQSFLASRPPSFETRAISEVVSLAALAPNLPLHIVHLSATSAIPILEDARSKGRNITAETCFHYLTLAAEHVPDSDTRFKCCPPIREQSNLDGLWTELLKRGTGVISTVVSDHSPCTPDLKHLPQSVPGALKVASTSEKTGDFFEAWGGVSSLGLGLPLLWTEGQTRGVDIGDIVRWCCMNTAKQVGLERRKGELNAGMDADIVVFDDTIEWTVETEDLLFRNKCSPHQKRKLRGKVLETWIRGTKVWDTIEGFAEGPTGQLLFRT